MTNLFLRALLLATLLAAACASVAQPEAPSRADLEALEAGLTAASELSDETRAQIVEQLKRAGASLERLENFRRERQALEEQVANSDSRIADYNTRIRDIEEAPATMERRLGSNPSLSAVESEIAVMEEQREGWVEERRALIDASASRATKEAERAARIAVLNSQLDNDRAKLDAGDPAATLQARIQRFAVRADAAAAEAEVAFLENSQRAAPAIGGLQAARLSWLDAVIDEADTLLPELRDTVSAKRKSAAQQTRAETRRLLASVVDQRTQLEAFAAENLRLVDEVQALSSDIERTRRSTTGIKIVKESIDEDAALTRQRLNVAGLEAQLGQVMLSRLESLPDTRAILAQGNARNARIATVSSAAIDSQQALRALGDRDRYLAEQLGDLSDFSPAARRATDRLLDQRREITQEKLDFENTLLRLLVDENEASSDLAEVVAEYRTFLTGNLLWVRNYSYLDPQRLVSHLSELAAVAKRIDLRTAWRPIVSDALFWLLLIAALILVARAPRLQGVIESKLGRPLRPSEESAALIAQTTFITALVSLRTPMMLLVLARAAHLLVHDAGNQATALSNALIAGALLVYLMRFLVALSKRVGVGRRLLKWNTSKVDDLTRDLGWFAPAMTLAIVLKYFAQESSPIHNGGGLVAIGGFSAAVLILLFCRRLLGTGQFDNDRLPRYCAQATVVISAAIVVMHLSGQLFAASLYLRALILSFYSIPAVLIVASAVQRFLVLYKARLIRAAREEEHAREGSGAEANDEAADPIGDPNSMISLSEAYTRLLALARILAILAVIWVVWAPALPALTILDSVTLWSTADTTLPEGELRPVTLAVLFSAIIILGITLFVTRQLPPLINVLLIEFTRVTQGSRYAAGMLMQYLIIGIGFSIAFSMLGFQWSKVQWLVAALGVGIGFGLQEIVANFISGLIVLFERPIRVGDIINAGGFDGTVTRINPRATVIETFEGKEVMIPNKELITNVVTNWSLSSSRLRIVVPVGVAYGCDVNDAMRRLVRLAEAHADVLEDPQPFATFEDFGDNALVLWLRCYALQDYLRIGTELRQAIYADFNEAGIGIAFPQRDIHLDASEPLPIRILPESTPDTSPG